MIRKNLLLTLMLTVFFAGATLAQGVVKGVVRDADSNETLIGATITVPSDKTVGTTTDVNGKFSLSLAEGSYQLRISYVGYLDKTVDVTVAANKPAEVLVLLSPSAIGLAGIEIMADRATERKTPVAVSNLDSKQIEEMLGSQDIPLVMNVTPNVYSTMQGGGSGDARINVRGFNQNNVAIMINGIPVNDMENGWVYWSNWDGIGDATSSIQMQRGLSAVNLATPSIGGTMNVITSPAAQDGGIKFKQEYGSGNFLKTTVYGNTGLIDGKYAVSAAVVRKTGDGVIDKTWTDAWAYYFGASYNISAKHRLELYAMGAPQKHGQNLYKQNAAAYDQEYAKDKLGYVQEALDKFPQSWAGREYNENWGAVNPSYTGQMYYNGSVHSRYSTDFINERENYFHKPLANLNWYAQFNDKISLFTSAYYSGGKGGGSGTAGSIKWDYSGPSRTADWNATIANNTKSDTAFGILRNSVNNQWTVGVISKLKWAVSENFNASFGIDGRTASIDHFREVRDLLGGKFYVDKKNDFESGTEYNKVLGDKFDYDFTNTVNWMGAYAQGEYTRGIMTIYATVGYSAVKYNYVNHFKKDDTGGELSSNTDWIAGYQAKGGLNFNLSPTISVYANGGYVSKVPIFDAVINDIDATVAKDPKNETFTSAEAGLNWRKANLAVSANVYYTQWNNRTRNIGVQLPDGSEGFVFITGMNQQHMGLELEANYQATKWLSILLAGSVNGWKYTDNVSGTYKDYSNPDVEETYNYYVKDLKVGDAPQTQLIYGLTFFPIKGMRLQAIGKFYADYYADWDPFTRTDETDKAQVWKTPSYNIFDLHASYDLPLKGKVGVQIFAHVFNLLDKVYVQDAVDNSPYNGYYGPDKEYSHTAMSAEVYLGLPRTYNFGILLNIK